MTTVLSHEAFHQSVGHAFGELFVLEQISQLPPESVLRILQTIPAPLLLRALAGCGTPSAPQAAQAERRAFSRRKVLRGAQLLREGRLLLEIQLRDISEGGCRIWTRRLSEVPDHFTIRIVGIAGERACEVRWRSEEELGVRFLQG
jgi:hypothetical protein